ncbi:DNA mismatch repair protein MutS [Lyngbya sp. PCC 8106]|uniref:DNA mismatch repair protein MutS n=1 Tax=Lyngbya sp. (strain PCC 8106) TaxID=313612 RepID=UPI0000EA9F0A|nr:DNA mismatch repair protein MutS [Lyngbya sp. PCC 8106]EAW36750.1 DNA mismatch repair protein [Lyngbya sp. PCC 8106]
MTDSTPASTQPEEYPNADYRQLDPSKLSEMMQRYIEVKGQYPHALLFFRVGDFFECFFQDAVTIARELELIQTTKAAGKEIGRVPMTGVPHEHVYRYSSTLLEKGYAVVICDQVEDAAIAAKEKRQVRREVTRVLTPGTLTDDNMLKGRQNNYLAAIVIAGQHWGLAYADISTGEFLTTQSENLEHLTQELMRLQPSEILFPVNVPDISKMLKPGENDQELPDCLPRCFCYSLRSQKPFSLGEAKPRILQQFQLTSLEGIGCEHLPLSVRTVGGLLEYLEDTQKDHITPLQRPRTYTLSDYLVLDHQSRRNLEITTTVRDNTLYGSLLWALDKTSTPMGSRALRRWLLQPLLDLKGIRARHDTIQEFVNNHELRQDIQQILRQIYDLERLTGRVGNSTANAKDLVSLADSLAKLPQLATVAEQGKSPYLKALQNLPQSLEKVAEKITHSLVESPPISVKEGELIRPEVDANLDEMRSLAVEDQQWIANLEVQERERTGIPTLKVGFNKTFGYYISISRGKAELAPDDYIRKQTLTNEERYITPELKEREVRILTAKEDLNQTEYDIFVRLRSEVAEYTDTIRNVSKAVAAIDVLCGLADVAIRQSYCCPEMIEGRELKIIDGRHPVVEKLLPPGFFVPNTAQLGSRIPDKEDEELTPYSYPDLIILTGPNASGKSCYLRQIGLIQLMAQMGSFIPASSAQLSLCDRIFTRVGAVDDLATGQSTFMVEMNETANILNHATEKSLVLLDEIGRGTATFDGLSIAWSVAEYLAAEIQAKTIFATHYHELNELASILENVANYQVTVKELPDKIVFLHQVQPGGADKSYGIEAGRLAGLPDVVIQRARQVMRQIEQHSKIAIGLRKGIKKQKSQTASIEQLDIFETEEEF